MTLDNPANVRKRHRVRFGSFASILPCALVRNPQHRTLPRPTETRLLAAFLNGAPRPMKMAITASPWRYDGLSDLGMSLAGVAVARRQRCNQRPHQGHRQATRLSIAPSDRRHS